MEVSGIVMAIASIILAADVSTVGGAALLPNPHTVCLSEAKAPVSPSDWVGSGGNGAVNWLVKTIWANKVTCMRL